MANKLIEGMRLIKEWHAEENIKLSGVQFNYWPFRDIMGNSDGGGMEAYKAKTKFGKEVEAYLIPGAPVAFGDPNQIVGIDIKWYPK